MSLPSAVIDAMVASGCSAEQLASAVKAANALADVRATRKREVDAARKRRERETKVKANTSEMSRGHGVTSTDTPRVPDKENPQTPKEINPTPPTPDPNGSATPSHQIAVAVDAYSAMASRAGLAIPRVISGARRQRIGAIIRSQGLQVWLEALAKIEASDFCRGGNDRGWKADLDFVTQAKSFAGILEGRYDNRARGSPARPNNALDLLRQQRESLTDAHPPPERPRLIASR